MWLQTLNKSLVRILIRAYQLTLSPLFHLLAGPGMGCRFEPTCSRYAQEALEIHGLVRGGLLACWRILRCNPFSRAGGDPVPRAIAKAH